MDLQETFDLVVYSLVMQNKRAVVAEEGRLPVLKYKTPDGLRDPIGWLIPDHLYSPDMEGYSFKGPDTWKQYDSNGGLAKLKAALLDKGVYADDEKVMRMLTDLQHVHDNNEPEFWPDRFRALARTWRVADFMLDHAMSMRDRRERLGLGSDPTPDTTVASVTALRNRLRR